MRRVRLYNVIPDFPFSRQLPADFSSRRGYAFSFGPGEGDYDYLVCYDQVKGDIITQVPKERRLLIVGEPPCITRYPASFLNQFGTVICPYDLPLYQGRQLRSAPALWWFFGLDPFDYSAPVLSYEELAAQGPGEKKDLLAAICSRKNFCARHRKRRDFVSKLQTRLGGNMVSFGPGFEPLPDKRDGIVPYKYHLVIENNDERKFWTEKLADAYLGYAFPFFVGGPEVEEDFPPGSMMRLDINDVEQSARVVEKAIAEHLWEERLPALLQAREKILGEYNAFSRMADAMDGMPPPELLPALAQPESVISHWKCREAYHFWDHLNHMAIKHLPFTRPIFKF